MALRQCPNEIRAKFIQIKSDEIVGVKIKHRSLLIPVPILGNQICNIPRPGLGPEGPGIRHFFKARTEDTAGEIGLCRRLCQGGQFRDRLPMISYNDPLLRSGLADIVPGAGMQLPHGNLNRSTHNRNVSRETQAVKQSASYPRFYQIEGKPPSFLQNCSHDPLPFPHLEIW